MRMGNEKLPPVKLVESEDSKEYTFQKDNEWVNRRWRDGLVFK